jgi:hypothetical protein
MTDKNGHDLTIGDWVRWRKAILKVFRHFDLRDRRGMYLALEGSSTTVWAYTSEVEWMSEGDAMLSRLEE